MQGLPFFIISGVTVMQRLRQEEGGRKVKEKNRCIKISRWWLTVSAVYVLMILIILRLYVITGENWHIIDISVQPFDTAFQLEVTSSNPQLDIAPLTDGLKLRQEKMQKEGMTGWIIQGTIPKESVGTRQEILVSCVDDQEEGSWKIRNWQKTGMPLTVRFEKKTLKWIYLLAAVFETLFLILFLYERKRGKYSSAAESAANQIYQNSLPGDVSAWQMGEQLFHMYEKRAALEEAAFGIIFGGDILIMAYLLIMKSGSSRGSSYVMMAFLYIIMVPLAYTVRRRKRSLQTLLQKETRPLTAAYANLMAAVCGSCLQRERQILLYHAALGFQRAGRFEAALLISNFWRTWPCKNQYLRLQESRVRSVCLELMGNMEEAKAEKDFQKQMQAQKPSFTKRQEERIYAKGLEMKIAFGEHRLEDACRAGRQYLQMSKEPGTWPWIYNQLRMIYREMGKEEEAQELERQLMSFSSENREVAELMQNDAVPVQKCAKEADILERFGKQERILRAGIGAAAGVILVLMIGAWVNQELAFGAVTENMAEAESQTAGEVQTEGEASTAGKIQTEMEAGAAGVVQTEGEVSTAGEIQTEGEAGRPHTENEEETERLSPPAFSVDIPDEWLEVTVEKERENGGRIYYQKSSYEKMGDGMIFSIVIYDDGSYIDVPESRVLGTDGPYVYLLCKPTDVCYYWEDDSIREEYARLQNQIEEIIKTFQIDSKTASYDGGEYIFPNSHQVYLKESELLNLSDDALRLAKNEIYARHGRRFQAQDLQIYFEGKSWYHGTVEASAFDESVFNQYEKANVVLIQKEQEKRE